jgi:hypothetical protein
MLLLVIFVDLWLYFCISRGWKFVHYTSQASPAGFHNQWKAQQKIIREKGGKKHVFTACNGVSGIGTSSRRICAFGFLLRQLEQQQ